MIFISLFGCKKDENRNPELDKLPPPTQNGANTCGCLLNDKAWIANVPDTVANVYTIGDRIFMNLYSSDTITILSLVVRGYKPVINESYKINNGLGWAFFQNDTCNYNSNSDLKNLSTISFSKLDTVNKVMSG